MHRIKTATATTTTTRTMKSTANNKRRQHIPHGTGELVREVVISRFRRGLRGGLGGGTLRSSWGRTLTPGRWRWSRRHYKQKTENKTERGWSNAPFVQRKNCYNSYIQNNKQQHAKQARIVPAGRCVCDAVPAAAAADDGLDTGLKIY